MNPTPRPRAGRPVVLAAVTLAALVLPGSAVAGAAARVPDAPSRLLRRPPLPRPRTGAR